ncbi:DUF3658 domain-containing protein [Psychrosphaera sp. 1_MG-2023]|uniref:DUF3658 domain-containing protein n=1 Tax=Psychrosphaera sp. 1_MG-2023 TaxID=3062643 RepID=UPI0026E1E3BD|nr:DUF3658 domain-containing protein [Psychrosphaera sp. 1_MG-2023]MDO6721636.1 DUF3658 domain-containing protein [Psychrosphaera sp. 1_MG-2023]
MEQPIESIITEDDLAYLQTLSPELLEKVDSLLYAKTSERWSKIAMVISKANKEVKILDPNITYDQLLSRLHIIIKSGKLSSQGNINIMRFSEVRRT